MMKKFILLICLISFSVLPFTETANAATYKYDERNRLIEVRYDNGHFIQYKYDSSGNIVKYTVSDRLVTTLDIFSQSPYLLISH